MADSNKSWLADLFSVKKVFGRVGEIVAQLGDYSASLITFNGAGSGIAATTVQGAIDEVATASQYYNEVAVTNLTGAENALSIPGFALATSAAISAVNLGSATINGILATPSDVNGTTKLIRLPYGTFTTTLVHNSGSASAGNKIIMPDGADISNQDSGGGSDIYVLLTRVNGNWLASRLSDRFLMFGTNRVALSLSAPSASQVLVASSTNAAAFVAPSVASLDRLASTNLSNATLTFTAAARWNWNGSGTPAFTHSATGAVDGVRITIFFPIGSISSFTLSASIDPTGAIAGTYNPARAAILVLTWQASGPCIIPQLFQVTDL